MKQIYKDEQLDISINGLAIIITTTRQEYLDALLNQLTQGLPPQNLVKTPEAQETTVDTEIVD